MLLLGYILVTCLKNNIVTLHVTFMLRRCNETCSLGHYIPSENWDSKSISNTSQCDKNMKKINHSEGGKNMNLTY